MGFIDVYTIPVSSIYGGYLNNRPYMNVHTYVCIYSHIQKIYMYMYVRLYMGDCLKNSELKDGF
jgi:hypothetical protein